MNEVSDADPALTVYEVAERWTSEGLAIGVETLALLLVERVVAGEIEVSGIAGNPRDLYELSFDWFAEHQGNSENDREYLHYARNLTVRLSELERFCGNPDFGSWGKNHGLDRPAFVRETSGDAQSIRIRKNDKLNEARTGNKVRKVLNAARHRWPNKKAAPDIRIMARLLCKDTDSIGYSFETVRKILAGKYDPMKKLNIWVLTNSDTWVFSV